MNKMIGTVTFSEKRKNLLLFLMDGPRTLEEIRTSLKVTSSGMIPQIRKLEEKKLVRSEDKKYALTDTGMVIADVFSSFIKTTEIIERYPDFWSAHEINSIPKHLLKRIYELGNCSLMESKLSEIHEPHRDFIESLSRSKKILGISPIFHSSYPPFFLHLARSGAGISLLLAGEVYDRLKNEHRDTLEEFLKIPATRLYVYRDHLNLACAVTDSYFNMSLFLKNGDYDSLRDIVSTDMTAIKWGEELFNHFLKNSNVIKGS
jgi:predicted transcriptional regulator